MSRDKRGNGIQEVDGSIPFGSTNALKALSLLTEYRAESLAHRWINFDERPSNPGDHCLP